MKKILILLVVAASSVQLFAQRSNVESAAIYLNSSVNEVGDAKKTIFEDAKKAIDLAADNEETKNDVKMWFYRAVVYDTIYHNPNFISMDKDAVEKSTLSYKKCLELDTKQKYEEYSSIGILNGAFACYNEAYNAANSANYDKAFKFYKMVLDVIPFDKEKQLAKNNLSEKNIYFSMAYFALKAEKKADAKIFLKRLMDLNYDDHLIYIYMSNIFLGENDTASALSYIEKGRKLYPSEKDLVNSELNIYLAQGKQDVLINKLNEAIEANPDNNELLYVRGNVNDNLAAGMLQKAKQAKDTASYFTKKSKLEKLPAKKLPLDNSAKQYKALADQLAKDSKATAAKAETDYNKVIEINPDYLDAYYNLGALTNNKSTEIVEKINAININGLSQLEYDKKVASYKKVQDSILFVALGYFNKALEITESKQEDTPENKKEKYAYMASILYSMQQVYANLGDEKKTIETKKRRTQYEN